MGKRWRVVLGAAIVVSGLGQRMWAEGCTTQSQMKAADRDALAAAAQAIATRIQSNDVTGLQGLTIAEYAKDFAGIRALAADTAQHLRGDALTVDQVYLLDGAQIKAGNAEPAQFFCSLNQTQATVDLTIPGLTPGVYGFAIVDARGPTPWRLQLLLRQDGGRWLLAGFYPRPIEAAGHDGVWYWREARRLAADKELWNAWLYYEEAVALLRPANFVQTTHLEKLIDEQHTSTPPPLSGGISADVPLVVRGANNGEYRVTSLAPDDPLGKPMLDVAIHVDAADTADATMMRARSDDAARALVGAYPELRKQFGGVFVTLENGGRGVYTIERPMAELR